MIRTYRRLITSIAASCALLPTAVVAQVSETQSGNYQALIGSEMSRDGKTEQPGLWLIDTTTGRVAFCQSGLINMFDLGDGITGGETHVSCTPWQLPINPDTHLTDEELEFFRMNKDPLGLFGPDE